MGKIKLWLASVLLHCNAFLQSWKAAYVSGDLAALCRDYVEASKEVSARVLKSRPMVWFFIGTIAVGLSLSSYWLGHRLASRHTKAANAVAVDLKTQLAAQGLVIAALTKERDAARALIPPPPAPAAKKAVSSDPPRKRRPYRRAPPRPPAQSIF